MHVHACHMQVCGFSHKFDYYRPSMFLLACLYTNSQHRMATIFDWSLIAGRVKLFHENSLMIITWSRSSAVMWLKVMKIEPTAKKLKDTLPLTTERGGQGRLLSLSLSLSLPSPSSPFSPSHTQALMMHLSFHFSIFPIIF